MARFSWLTDVRALDYLSLIKDRHSCLWAKRDEEVNPVIKGGRGVSDGDQLELTFSSSGFQMPQNRTCWSRIASARRCPCKGSHRETVRDPSRLGVHDASSGPLI